MPGVRVDDQVEVALPDPGLGVGEPAALVGQRAQALGGDRPAGRRARTARRAGDVTTSPVDADVVAEVDVGGPAAQPARAEPVGASASPAASPSPSLQHGEAQPAEVAHAHAPGRSPTPARRCGVRRQAAEPLAHLRRASRCGRARPGRGRCPRRAAGRSLRAADPHLLRQAGARVGERGRDRVGVRSGLRRRRRSRRARPSRSSDAVRAAAGAGSARSRKPSATPAAMPIRGRSRGSREAEVARRPRRAGTWRWRGRATRAATSASRRRSSRRHSRSTGPAPIRSPSLERGPEHGEVQRDPLDAERRGRAATSAATMNSVSPLSAVRSRRIRSSESPSAAPRHERQQRRAASPVGRRSASTSTQSPSAGSPSRHSAMEKPRSVSVSRQASARSTTSRHLARPAARACRRIRDGVARTARPGCTAWRTGRIVAAFQGELPHVDDGLVAELDGAAARRRRRRARPPRSRPSRPGSSRSGAPRRATPRSPPGHASAVADRVAAGQADGRRRPGRSPPTCRLGENTAALSRRVAK